MLRPTTDASLSTGFMGSMLELLLGEFFQGSEFSWRFTWAFSPGYNRAGFQPSHSFTMTAMTGWSMLGSLGRCHCVMLHALLEG